MGINGPPALFLFTRRIVFRIDFLDNTENRNQYLELLIFIVDNLNIHAMIVFEKRNNIWIFQRAKQMFNSSSHLIGDMARMQHEDLIRYAAEQRLHRLGTPDSNARWTKARTIFGDWLITAGQQLKPATQPVIGHQAP